MKTLKLISLFLMMVITLPAIAQEIPDRPSPPRLVNDYTGTLAPDQLAALEHKLVAFNDSTSTQISVAIVKSLNGYDIADFTYRLGQKWGVGQKGKNNGTLILVKPKTASEKGEAYIASGYGLEDVIPDAVCKRIVENEMIPLFRDGNYYGGIDAATSVIMDLAKGKYTAVQYQKKHEASPIGIIIPIIILAVVLFAIRASRNSSHSVGKNLPWWMALFMLGSMGRGNSGSWNDFSSGSGFFGGGGGGGGGFGGFGGGSFGGGGAGGSW
ncbi:MAG: TPM domain-containing protein [Bacteroidetes bacterium]|nr:TPM domain-containing protein [Bacteroidota bacterium]